MSPGDGHGFSTDASLENLHEARAFINRTGEELGVDQAALADLCLAVDEAVTNVVLHGYAGKGGPVEIEMESSGADVRVVIRDRARVFNADDVAAPQLETELSERPFGGMGVFLIDRMTDEHEFRARPGGGNELVLVKKNAISG